MRIKICGITNIEDGQQAAKLGADAIGLNFYPKSKRFITFETARAIIDALPPFVDPVGLFVNQPMREIISWARDFGSVRTLQIHGDILEPVPDESYQFIPAFSVRNKDSLEKIDKYMETCRKWGRLPSAILVDAHVAGEYGGTGQTAPWHLLAEYRVEVPLILAGGLTPENVEEAIRIVQPYAVDVASGVEISPGKKDAQKIERFIINACRAGEWGVKL